MATINLASSIEHAILMTSDVPPGGEPNWTYTIFGTRDPGAVGNLGITYYVQSAVYDQWSVRTPDLVRFVKPITQEQIGELRDPTNTHGYELGLAFVEDNAPQTAPPVNTTVPHVSQAGSVLTCTKGIWDNRPDSYTYAWQMGGAPNGVTTPDYDVQAGDVGQSFACVVTATNPLGSATAPVSNSVVAA